MKKLLLLVLLSGLLASGGELRILCTTDIHGHAEELTQLAGYFREAPENTIRIDCGDTLQGTLLGRHSSGSVMTALLNALNYDIWVPGNHDFEFGPEALERAARDFRGATLGAEFRRDDFRPQDWTLLQRAGYRIAVIGMTDPKMPRRLLPDSGWNFEPNADALRRIMPEVLNTRPNLIVLAWHAGLYTPPGSLYRFLKEFPEIDLVLAGHSHEENPGKKVGNAWFVQAGRYGSCVARIRAEFDDADGGRLIRITSELLRPDPSRHDAAAKQTLEPFLAAYRPFAREVLTTTASALRLPEKRENDSALGELGAQAMRAAAGTDAALFSAAASFELEIPRAVTNADLFRLLPYENELCTVELTRGELELLVEELLAASRRGRAVFTFSGIRATVDRKGNLRKLDAPEKLSLALTAYTLSTSPLLRARLDSGAWKRLPKTEREAVTEYLRKHPAWSPSGKAWISAVSK